MWSFISLAAAPRRTRIYLEQSSSAMEQSSWIYLAGCGPYLIVGSAHKHWYEGKNSASGRQYEVDAKWADVGGTYVGIWVEGNEEFLFSFKLA